MRSEEGPRWRIVFSCSSSLDFTEEFVKRHFHGSGGKRLQNSVRIWNTVGRCTNKGNHRERMLIVTSEFLHFFFVTSESSDSFVSSSDFLWSGSKFLLIKCSGSLDCGCQIADAI